MNIYLLIYLSSRTLFYSVQSMKVDKVKRPKQKTRGSLGKVSTDSVRSWIVILCKLVIFQFVIHLAMCKWHRHFAVIPSSNFPFINFSFIYFSIIKLFTPSVPDRRGLYGNLGGTGAAGARGWDSGYPYRTDSSGFPYDSTRPGTSGPRGKEIYNYLLC